MATRDFRLLSHFVAIVEAGSLRRAAARLGLSPPVLSASLAELEAVVGQTLILRGRRRSVPTQTGSLLHARAADIVRAAEGLIAEIRGRASEPAGTLAVTLPTELALCWLPDRLRAFEARHPKVAVRLDLSDQVVDLTGSEIEVAVRTHALAPGEAAPAEALEHLPLTLVAQPERLKGTPGDATGRAAALPFIAMTPQQLELLPRIRAPNGRVVGIAPRAGLTVSSGAAARDLARQGLGTALVIRAAVVEDLESGRLVEVLPGHDCGAIALRMVLRDALPGPAAREFVKAMQSRPDPSHTERR